MKRRGRGAVVHLDRSRKARMVHAIVTDFIAREAKGLKVLDIGAGNGEIGELFADDNDVVSVDIVDQRRADGKARFVLVGDERLPFRDASFDLVITHHVIEHVADQDTHLTEIKRVVRDNGVAYLATPNQSSPIMEGHAGNDMVMRYREMLALFQRHGCQVTEYGWRVAHDPVRFHAEQRYGRYAPTWLLLWMRRLFPSHMFVLRWPRH